MKRGLEFMATGALLFFLVPFGFGSVVVLRGVYGTAVKDRWGFNLAPVICPRCNTPLEKVRKPQSVRQAMWGGGTCAACGTEVDKWGREVPLKATVRQEDLSGPILALRKVDSKITSFRVYSLS